MAVIKDLNLFKLQTSQDGEVKSYKAPISKVEGLSNETKDILIDFEYKLRQLHRSDQNLWRSKDCFIRLMTYFCEKRGIFHSDLNYLEVEALHCYGVMLYRACFVKDNKQKQPLSFLEQTYKENTNHQQLKSIGDKLYGHLDQNHEHREDNVFIQLIPASNGKLEPSASTHSGHMLKLSSFDDVTNWIDHIESTRHLISSEIKRIEGEIKGLLPDGVIISSE